MSVISNQIVKVAQVVPHYGGGGRYDLRADSIPDETSGGWESVEDYHEWLIRDGLADTIEIDVETSGRTYGQGDRIIYRYTSHLDEVIITRECVWTETLAGTDPIMVQRVLAVSNEPLAAIARDLGAKPGSLTQAAKRGSLPAALIGRLWTSTRETVEEYLATAKPGRPKK